MFFGEYLVKNGILTEDQLNEILKVQLKISTESGKRKLLGDIAVDLGYIKKNKIEEAFLKYFKED